MKEMIYTSERTRELLHNDIYKGYHYYIMSYGTHPCCYIELHKDSILYGVNYDDIDMDVHGGLTYSKDYLKTGDNTTVSGNWFIGWDYGHCTDYIGLDEIQPEFLRDSCKRWTTKELIAECENAIELVIRRADNE